MILKGSRLGSPPDLHWEHTNGVWMCGEVMEVEQPGSVATPFRPVIIRLQAVFVLFALGHISQTAPGK